MNKLLEREDVTPDNTNKDGRRPLLWAIINRHEGIVKMLLGREGASPDTADSDGRTPLFWATGKGIRAS